MILKNMTDDCCANIVKQHDDVLISALKERLGEDIPRALLLSESFFSRFYRTESGGCETIYFDSEPLLTLFPLEIEQKQDGSSCSFVFTRAYKKHTPRS